MKIYIFDTQSIVVDQEKFSNSLNGHEVVFISDGINTENASKYSDAEIISVFVSSDLSKKTLDQLPNLKMISTRSTGVDHIDVKEAEMRKIEIKNVAGYGSTTVAEFTFALILAISRKVDESANDLRQEIYRPLSEYSGFDLKDKTIAVIGTGAIGLGVIKIAKGFGMKIIANDVLPKQKEAQEIGFEYKDIKQVVSEADIVSIHVPFTSDTYHLFNSEMFSLMKKGAILINTARGDIVDTDVLVKSLENKGLSGAALDVYEGEKELSKGQLSENLQKLMKMPNVILTPHIAFASIEAIEKINFLTLKNIVEFSTKS